MQGREPRRLLGATLGLLSLAALGGVATALSAARAMDTARAADERAAAVAADRISTQLSASLALLGGSNALAIDGDVSETEFAAFASDVLPGSPYSALAYAEPVSDADRSSWETETGYPMIDTDGRGGFVDGTSRPEHVVVRFAEPLTDTTRRVLGFDLMSDEVRASGVEKASGPEGVALVGPIGLATSGLPGLFVVNAVDDPSGNVAGYIASGMSIQVLAEEMDSLVGTEPIAVLIDGTLLTETGSGSASAEFQLAGRSFEVQTGDADGVDWQQTVLVALTTIAVCAGAGVVASRSRRDARRRERGALRNQNLAELSEGLIHTDSPDSVVTLGVATAARVVGADRVEIGMVGRDSGEILVSSSDADGVTASTPGDGGVLWDSIRENRTVEAWNSGSRTGRTGTTGRSDRYRSALAVPLGTASEAMGAITFEWTKQVDDEDRGDARAAAELVAQVIGRAHERAIGRQRLQERVVLLSRFSSAIAAAHSLEEISSTVTTLLPPMLGVASASLVHHNGTVATDPMVRQIRLSEEDDLDVEVVLRNTSNWTETSENALRAVVDLLAGATERARRSAHEHSVLLRLQEALLTPPPQVPGFDLAVSYRSALQSIGIGGDWYSVVDADEDLFLVIGDVAGHGPGAVALMAQVKTVIRHLLTVGASIEVALHQAGTLLEGRNAYASAVITRVSKVDGSLSYVNAGHPAPLIRLGTEVEVLGNVHRPWLGVASEPVVPTTVAFPLEATLLLYTDGLIEERRTVIDDSIAELASSFAESDARPDELVRVLAANRSEARGDLTVDDDIAMVAVTRTIAPRTAAHR